MVELFKFKKKPSSYLGIDLGTSSIKMVELAREENYPKLLTYSEYKIPSDKAKENVAFGTSSLNLEEKELAEILKLIIKESRAQSSSATISIPVYSSFFTVMELPMMSRDELVQAVSFQARQYIPVPLAEVVLDWTVLDEEVMRDKTRYQQVVLVAVPKEIVNKYTKMAELAGLNLRALEVETFSLARALIRKDDPGVNVLIDMGARNTNVSIVEKGMVRASHNFDISGRDLTRAIARSLNIDWQRAEEIKVEKGLETGESEMGIAHLLIPLLDNISSEIEKAFNLYRRRYGREVDKFILAGGGSQFPGIQKYFVERFGKEVIAGDPFANIIYPAILEDMVKKMGPSFAVAVGLALRELNINGLGR